MKLSNFVPTPAIGAISAVLISAALSSSAFGKTVYLKADATGDKSGESWGNAYTTVADAIAALNAAGDGAELRIAQGVYSVTAGQTISINNAVIRGGYRAAEDGDEVRDTLTYQTIVSGGTTVTSDYWRKYDPVTEMFTDFETTDPKRKIVVDGRMNLPNPATDYANDFDMWYLKSGDYGLYGANILTLSAENITVSGLCMAGARDRSNIYMGAAGGVVDDCVFFANRSTAGCVQFCASGCAVRNCRFLSNRSSGNALSVMFQNNLGKNCRMENCYHEGNYVGASYGAALISVVASGAIVSNVVATRTFAKYTANTYHQSYGGVGCVFRDQAQRATVRNFVATNNLTRSTSDYASPIFLARYTDVRDSYFANNRSEAHAVANLCYSPFVCNANGSYDALWSNCVFRANEIRVTSCSAASGATYALAMLCNCKDGYRQLVYNCTFDSNLATVMPEAEVEGVDVIRSRGVVHQAISADGGGVDVYKHLTFIGPKTPGVYDVAQFGGGHGKNMTVSDSLFLLTDVKDICDSPFYVTVAKYFKPTNCTLQNETLQPSADYTVTGLYFDAVPFVKDPLAGVADAQLRPAARTPGMLETSDGAARGAVPLTETAANGLTLTVRASPLDGGTLSVPSTQAVLPGSAIVPITAMPAEGVSFDGWYYDGADVPFEKSVTLSGLTLAESDKIVIAKYGTKTVRITFSLDGKCTFADSGETTYEVEAHAGDFFPEPPAVVDSESWHFVGWSLPLTVPSGVDELTVVAKIVTKDVRVVYLTTTGAGKKDGTSWANAYGSLAEACADAGAYRGEVWIQEGVYKLDTPLKPLSNVKLIGGFAEGVDTSDPVANPTIFTGDLALNDNWKADGVTSGKICENGRIAYPPVESQGVKWTFGADSADMANAFVHSEADGEVTNSAFTGVCFYGFYTSAFSLGAGSELSFENCNFLANGLYDNSGRGSIVSDGTVHVKSCRFTGGMGQIVLTGKSADTTNTVEDCLFDNNSGSMYGVSIWVSDSNSEKALVVRRSSFVGNRITGNTYWCKSAAAIGMKGKGALVIEDCVFSHNMVANDAIATVLADRTYGSLEMRRCRFTGNTYSSSSVRDGSYNCGYMPGTPCLTVMSMSSALIEGCLFASNTATVATSKLSTYPYASAIGMGDNNSKVTIANTTFFGNSVRDVAETPFNHVGTIVVASPDAKTIGASFAVVNCAFKDNVASGKTAAEVNVRGWNDDTYASRCETVTFLNSVLWNDDDDYLPIGFYQTACKVQIDSCAMKNFDRCEFAADDAYSFVRRTSGDDPKLFDRPVAGEDGKLPQLGVHGDSWLAKKGVPVYLLGTKVYYYDPVSLPKSPWRVAADRTAVASAVEGLDVDSPLLPDAWGRPREKKHIASGPLNADPTGFLLMVR